MNDRATVTWTKQKLVQFRPRYTAARVAGKQSFVFEDHEYVTDYAMYLIEYLEGQFGGRPQ
jgi:hypothetical protein